MNFLEALAFLIPGTNIKRSGWLNKEIYINSELSNLYDKILKLVVLENSCGCTSNLSNEDITAEDWITSSYALTNFNDALINLNIGKKARRLLSNTDSYLVLLDGDLVSYNSEEETFSNICLNSNDVLANDWIILE